MHVISTLTVNRNLDTTCLYNLSHLASLQLCPCVSCARKRLYYCGCVERLCGFPFGNRVPVDALAVAFIPMRIACQL